MPNKYGSHVFRGINGSMVDLEVNLHENIDFDFFDGGENISLKDVPDDLENQTSAFTNSKTKRDCDMDYGNIPVSILPTFKDDKFTKHKDLMNCIAFETECGNIMKEKQYEDHKWVETNTIRNDDNDSVSTDTTSDITDVTPRPSSSGCSSMSKLESEKEIKSKTSTPLKISKHDKNHVVQNRSSMKFLKEALDNLECDELSTKSSNLSSEKTHNSGHQNMSFTKDELWKIERDNHILLRKIEGHIKRPKQGSVIPHHPRLSSSAINRQKQQKKIDHDNMILLRKIKQVKGTTQTMTSLRRQ